MKLCASKLLHLLCSACLGGAEALASLHARLKLFASGLPNQYPLAAGDAAAHEDPCGSA